MGRDKKTASMAELQLIIRRRAQHPPVGWRTIAHEINERRGALRVTLTAAERQQRSISHERLRQIYEEARQTTKPSNNDPSAPTDGCQTKSGDVDGRRTEPQAAATGGHE